MMRLIILLGASWQLARLVLLSRFRLRGAYWVWRYHTAFGKGAPARSEMIRGIVEYGCWVHTIRSLR